MEALYSRWREIKNFISYELIFNKNQTKTGGFHILLKCFELFSSNFLISRQRLYNQWQQQLQALKNEKNSLMQDNQVLEQAMATCKVDYASLQSKYEGLHQQLQEKQARIDELNRLNKQAQENLEHYRETSREQRMLDQQKAGQQQQMLEQVIQQLQQDGRVSRSHYCNRLL